MNLKLYVIDFDSLNLRTVSHKLTNMRQKLFGVSSAHEVSGTVFLVSPKKVANEILAPYLDKENTDGVITPVKQSEVHSDDIVQNEENIDDTMTQLFSSDDEINELENDILNLENFNNVEATHCKLLQAQNESLLLEIQELQFKRFPLESNFHVGVL